MNCHSDAASSKIRPVSASSRQAARSIKTTATSEAISTVNPGEGAPSNPSAKLGDGPEVDRPLLPLGFKDKAYAIDREGHVDLTGTPDAGLHPVKTPAAKQFGNEVDEALSADLRRHPLQLAEGRLPRHEVVANSRRSPPGDWLISRGGEVAVSP